MDKKLQAVILIASILLLALKDSASFVHTVLHSIPNPWHHHKEISPHKQHIDPLQIHTYLQHKHTHTHHDHSHTHDVMDHIHHDEHEQANEHSDASNELKPKIKIDYYAQSLLNFPMDVYTFLTNTNHFSAYLIFMRNRGVTPPYQPPQV